MTSKAFTLIELMVVMAIMGLLGVFAMAGFRQAYRGIEERGTLDATDQFLRAAYQRAQIDRVPIYVYFWNETIREEDEDAGDSIVVVGHAVAVRQCGRITGVGGQYLYDEFNDLETLRWDSKELLNPGEGPATRPRPGPGQGMNLYCLDGSGSGMRRTLVADTTVPVEMDEQLMVLGLVTNIQQYAYEINTGGSTGNYNGWRVGQPYGVEIMSMQLPKNFFFESSYSANVGAPIYVLSKTLSFFPSVITGSGASGGVSGDPTVTISTIRPNKSGNGTVSRVGATKDPSSMGGL